MESLFETKKAKGRVIYRIFASTVFLGICLIWIYRVTHLPAYGDHNGRRWIWIGLFVSELWFGFYWILTTQSVRWNLVFRSTFKDRISQRFEQDLPGVDIFVCTADPKISSPWFLPFAYVITAKYSYSLAEFLWFGGTVLGWWNEQRIWLYKRTTSYLFGFIDATLKQLGFSETSFVVTAKVSDEQVSTRFEQEMMEFGTSSPMFTILATLALVNMICFVSFLTKKVIAMDFRTDNTFNELGLQIFLCGFIVLVNFPLFHAMFVRKDNGKMPMPVAVKSALAALLAWTCSTYM